MATDKRKKIIIPEEEFLCEDYTPNDMRPLEGEVLDAVQQDRASYSMILQGKGLHGLFSSSSRRSVEQDKITHAKTIQSDGVLIIIDPEAIYDLTPQTFKALIFILTAVTKQLPRGNAVTAEAINERRTVQIPLSEYMATCKIKGAKEARKQLNEAILALYGVSLEWDEQVYEKPEGKSRAVKVTKHHRMRITDHAITQEEGNPVKRGVAEFRFSYDMAEYLSNSYIMPFPVALLTINTVYNPYSIPLGWKLCALDNINIQNNHHEKIGTTTVKTLLSAAKGLPRYEDISATGGIYRLIISRLDRDLAALVNAGVLSDYWYFKEDKKPIRGDQLALLSYAEFSTLSVHYELKDYPDQTPRLEAKSKRLTAAINRRKAAAKKKEKSIGDGEQQ